jgi:GTP-binding protein
MDARHPLTELDSQMLDWFLPSGRPVHILLAKCDKLSTGEQRRVLEVVHKALTEAYGGGTAQIAVQLFSATRRAGVAEAEMAVESWLGLG